MTIKRYSFGDDFGEPGMVPDHAGDYVKHDDHLALVAAAYRDAVRNILGVTIIVAPDGISHREGAESVRRQLAGFIETLPPADAEARLTALLRAEYERGVREAALKAYQWGDADDGQEMHDRILALLTQEGR